MDDFMGTFVVLRPAASVPSIEVPASCGGSDVLVWPADLDGWTWDGQEPDGLLSADERARAARFVFEKDRRRFVTGRAVLRTLLGRCLGRPAAGLTFRYGPQGKPMIADADLWFNVSASAGKALSAVSRRVGVDIERIRDIEEMDAVASRVLSAAEREWLRGRRAAERKSGFFRCWTRKEAVVKGLGAGLSMPLDRFDVGPGRRGLVRISASGAPGERRHWIVRDIPVFPGFAAAAAAETSGVGPEALSSLREERA
jgi:4'-phosphopantetheinyl transferase